MNQQRLRLPNETVERCTLCEAVLNCSVENPRRVCGKCGSVNLPNDEVAFGFGHHSSRWLSALLDKGLGTASRPRWRIHGIALGVQLTLALLVAWGLGSGSAGKFDLGWLFAFLTVISFCAYALVTSLVVFFTRRTWQVVVLDLVVPLLPLLVIVGTSVPSRSRHAPPTPIPAATVTARPTAPAAKPRPRAPDAPGWEGSKLLASFSATQDGAAFTLRFVPHFTGTLEVSTRHPILADVAYGHATCAAKAEEPSECTLINSTLLSPSAVAYELSAIPSMGPKQRFGSSVTVVRVDGSGNGRTR